MRHPLKTDIWDARNFVTDFCKKNMKFQLLRACQPQNALLNFLKKTTFSTLQKCEIALSCRRNAYFRNASLLQKTAFVFLRFYRFAWRLHETHIFPVGSLQNGSRMTKNWFLKKRSDFCPPEGPQKDLKRTPK